MYSVFAFSWGKMTDFFGLAFQGFFTGVGTATALWFHEKYIKPKLERLHGNSKVEGGIVGEKNKQN